MDNEVKYVCKCGTELPPNHTGPCPKCGRIGEVHRVFEKSVSDGITVKDSISGTHKLKWSSSSLTLLSIWVAIFLTIAIPGIQLLPFRPGVNYGILLCLLLVMVGVLWWKRHSILMLIRRLEGKLGGEKRF